MKKLHVKTTSGWTMVFCRDAHNNRVITTNDPKKALPSFAAWGVDDLLYFRQKFANLDFSLQVPA